MRLVRIISSDDVRSMCIRYDFYTCGDCKDYMHMLNDLCGGSHRREVSDLDIEMVARDIVSHSCKERFVDIADDTSFTTCLKTVICLIANDCCTTAVS